MSTKTKARIDFGNRLRAIRTGQIKKLREKRISQEELGFRAGLHRTYIGAIERGEESVSVDNVTKIAKALRVPVEELFK